MISALERRAGLDAASFRDEYARRNAPVVITGESFWSGAEPLTPEWLRGAYGTLRLGDIRPGQGAVTGVPPRLRDTTLADYLETLVAADARLPATDGPPRRGLEAMETAEGLPYLTNLDLEANFPGAARCFSTLPGFGRNWLLAHRRGRQIGKGEIFIGPAGTGYGKLHFDRYNFYVATYQLFGTKQWWLYPPSESRYLYPMPFGHGWYRHLSPIDQESCDLERYPLFAHARGFSTVIGPGEVLFCPASWWHNTRNLTGSISVAVRMVTSGNVLSMLKDYLISNAIDFALARHRAGVLAR
jgi:[protein]-arginine 3-hydroxylase / protease